MRKSIATTALAGSVLLLGTGAAHAETSSPAPSSPTASSSSPAPTEHKDKSSDKTGLWGLLGLAGLLGLIPRKKHVTQRIEERPVRTETHRETTHTTGPARTETVGSTRGNTDVREGEVRHDVRDDIRDGDIDGRNNRR